MTRPREVGYTDELLADGSVHRTYEDGRQEWRRRAGQLVRWHDNRGASGTDELLGQRIIKRSLAGGTVSYGKDIGYGRTVWERGELVTVNRTSFSGRMGAVLAGLGVVGLALTAAQLPPANLTPQEEEQLRRQQAAQAQSSSSSDVQAGSDGSGATDSADRSEEDDSRDDWDGGDFDGDDGDWNDDDFG